MKKALLLAVIATSFSTVALAKTQIISGLERFDCMVESVNGQLEKSLPVGKTILAQSEAQATAMYLLDLEADMSDKTIRVPYHLPKVDTVHPQRWATLKAVNCSEL